MSKVAQAKAALEAAQEDLAKALKEEKGAVVAQMRDDIVSMGQRQAKRILNWATSRRTPHPFGLCQRGRPHPPLR